MSRVGIIGGGQLARMLGADAFRLGIETIALDPSPRCPASATCDIVVGELGDQEALGRLLDVSDVVTCELEHLPHATIDRLAGLESTRPNMNAVRICGDRLLEKRFVQGLGVETAPFHAVDDLKQAEDAARAFAGPMVLKTRREGYDGKGQAWVRTLADVEEAFASLGQRPCVAEGKVSFTRELSILGVRGLDGEVRTYPLVENVHEAGVLRLSLAPADVSEKLEVDAREIATAILEALDYVGVLAIELFETDKGLVVNEIAPRVHNSGHWTIEGSATSQFENHLRAVLGLPLGDTSTRGHSAMVNILGHAPPLDAMLRLPGARLHLYGKAPRENRKLGHITISASDRAELDKVVAQAMSLVAL